MTCDLSENLDRSPGLDGLRGISIVLVLITHSRDTSGFPSIVPAFLTNYAGLGVEVFFVISGFLISSLLIAERDKHGTIDVPAFYVRRAIRILPACMAFVLAMTTLRWFSLLEFSNSDLLAAATYTMNFVQSPSWCLGHIWSLSVEEQFYLLWPAVLAFCSRANAILTAAAVFIISPILMGVSYYLHWPYATLLTGRWFPFVADSIAAGCLLAFGLPVILAKKRYRTILHTSAGWALIPILFLLYACRNHPRLFFPFGEWSVLLIIVYFVARLSSHPVSILESAPFKTVGTLSYSLYLWQQPFLQPRSAHWITSFPQNILLSLAVAYISYSAIERPLLSLKKHFQRNWLQRERTVLAPIHNAHEDSYSSSVLLHGRWDMQSRCRIIHVGDI